MGINSILTVVTPATSSDLTVLATVKSDLGISGTSEDTKLARWITEASEIIATKCNRVFGMEDLSEQFRCLGNSSQIVLSRRPIDEIDTVTENDVELVEDTDFEIEQESGILYRLCNDRRIFWWPGKTVVEYSAGYTLLDGLPRDLEKACIKLIGHYRATATRDPFVKGEQIDIPGVRSKRIDYWVGAIGGNDTSDLPPEVDALIAPFRNVLAG